MTSAEVPSSLAALPSSPHLPVELLAQIVNEAAGDRDYLDYTTLRHLCLTSRSILPFARSALYRDILITFDDDEGSFSSSSHNDDDVIYNPLELERHAYTNTGDSLEATLAQHTHLASLAKGLMFIHNEEDELSLELPQHFIKALWRSCPDMSSFRSSFIAGQQQMAVIVKALVEAEVDLVELEVHTTPDLPRLLARLPHLRQLHLHVGGGGTATSRELVFPFRLKSLRINYIFTPTLDPVIFEPLLASSVDSLAQLHLSDLPAAVQFTPHVHRFEALTHFSYLPAPKVTIPPTLLSKLASCPSLQSLHLRATTALNLSALPPQLHAVRFKVGHDGARLISEFLAIDQGEHKLLRRVEVDHAHAREWDHGGAAHGWRVARYRKKVVFLR